MRRAMASPVVQHYNVVVIDTQGAVGELQKTAAMAADYMISPIKPDTLSAGEFSSGTLAMLDELNRLADFGETFQSGDLYALINAQERNNNARTLTTVIRQKFAGYRKVRVLDTVVPSAASYAAAATAQSPVHRYDRRLSVGNSAWHIMHRLVWELFPTLTDIYVDDVCADVGEDQSGVGESGEVS
jgi:chromosome partitioning related protein ParA